MESIGQILKIARQKKNITLEEAAKRTKVHINILRAFEEDRFESLSPIYAKGFLKIYSRFLDINPDDLIAGYEKKFGARRQYDVVIKPSDSSLKISSKTVRLSDFSRYIKPLIIILCCIAVLFLFIVLVKGFVRKVSLKRSVASPSLTVKSTKSPFTKPEALTKAIAAAKAEPAKQEPITGLITVGLRAKEDTWIMAKVDGEVMFKGTLKKNRSQSWQAKQAIELSIGNAGTVGLEFNGKFISPLGKRGQALKHVLIDKNGLSTK